MKRPTLGALIAAAVLVVPLWPTGVEAAPTASPDLRDPQVQWDFGYTLWGGENLPEMHRIIKCESGGTKNPFRAVGDNGWSRDHGRAQINDYWWADRFEEEFGVPFEDWIYVPFINGAMSAIVEQESWNGLGAWACARIVGVR